MLRNYSIVLLAGTFFGLSGLGTLGTTCIAASADFSAAQLSRIWREEFPVPSTPVPRTPVPRTSELSNPELSNPVLNAGMAPPALGTVGTANAPLLSQQIGSQFMGAGVQLRSDRPHPAVARIIVPEEGAISYGSGTLIDVREKFGMVITNWHVVRDATGTIEVVFPGGFTSKARALKVDADWDLAALVIWQPPVEPVSIAADAPRPGDQLTICGYGQGNYRCATGRCTQYYAPRLDFPRHMVELDVEARQGDSGGPIFNRQGELAGVLFGAGQGTTLGSFGGRVGAFLATLAPDIGRAAESLAANRGSGQLSVESSPARQAATLQEAAEEQGEFASAEPSAELASLWPSQTRPKTNAANDFQAASSTPWQSSGRENLFEQLKTVLAAVGLLAIVVQVLRVAR